jgi:hypothetical protein
MRLPHTLSMVDTPQTQEEKRLIILLPAELLEELRQVAEAEDLSVSQIVRRAIRRELQAIPLQKAQQKIWSHLDNIPLSLFSGEMTHEDKVFLRMLRHLKQSEVDTSDYKQAKNFCKNFDTSDK